MWSRFDDNPAATRKAPSSLRSNANVTKSARDTLALPYAELVASGKFKATDDTVGWP
jgi:hypothetical protein